MMEIRINGDFKKYIDKKVNEAVEDIKKGFIEKMREEITKLQTYKMFSNEDTVYVELDEVLKIFDEYSTGGEENGDCD